MNYVYRDERDYRGTLRHYDQNNMFVHGQPVGKITPRDWSPIEIHPERLIPFWKMIRKQYIRVVEDAIRKSKEIGRWR